MAKKEKKTIQIKALKKVSAKKTVKKAVKKSAKIPVKKKNQKKKKDDLMCFLTTACVEFYGLKDNGYELSTLRSYRDTYLASTEAGKELIQSYYKISPLLVTNINKDENKAKPYKYIHEQILKACSAIEIKQFVKAKNIYSTMVRTLMEKYS